MACFHQIPAGVILDHVIPHLSVVDILAFRRVCRDSFLLTCDPETWYQILDDMEINAPPLLRNMKEYFEPVDFEAEQLVARAVSLNFNWRRKNAKIYRRRRLLSSYAINEMIVVPGGKILAASASIPASHEHVILLYAVHRTTEATQQPIVRFTTPAKPYNVRAIYSKYDDQPGLMIMFMQRVYTLGRVSAPTDATPDSFQTDNERFTYLITVLFAPWDVLGQLVDHIVIDYQPPSLMQPPIFQEVFKREFETQVDEPCFFELDLQPWAAVILKPNHIVFMNLHANMSFMMTCEVDPNQSPYFTLRNPWIRTFCVLPDHKEVLVIFTEAVEPDSAPDEAAMLMDVDSWDQAYVLTLHYLPAKVGIHTSVANQCRVLPVEDVERVQITPYHPSICRGSVPPPPISLFIKVRGDVENTSYMDHYTIWPSLFTVNDNGKIVFEYSLDDVTLQGFDCTHVQGIMTGVHRAISYNQTAGVFRLRRYTNPELSSSPLLGWLRRPSDALPVSSRPASSQTTSGDYPLIQSAWDEFGDVDEMGVAALAWDEWTGTVCIASGGTTSVIEVLEYGQSFDLGTRHSQWMTSKSPSLLKPRQRRFVV